MTERYTRSGDVLWRRSGDTVVLLSAHGGDVVELSGTGPALWDLLADPITVDEAARSLSRVFGATGEVVAGAIEPVIHQLAARSLIDAVDDVGPVAP